MGRKYSIRDQDKFYFVTFTVIHWLDVFIREHYRQIVLESIKYCQREKGLLVGAWCIMTSHIHMIIGTEGENRLQDIVRDFKAYTSRHLRKSIEGSVEESRREWLLNAMKKAGHAKSNNKDFQFWMQHNHPIEMNSDELIDSRLEYIHQNPVEAGFVEEVSHWKYSSAIDYSGGKGLIDLIFLE